MMRAMSVFRQKMWKWLGREPTAVDGEGSSEFDRVVAHRTRFLLCLWLGGVAYASWSISFSVLDGLEKRDFAIFWLAGKLALTDPAIAYDTAAFANYSLNELGLARAALPYPPHFLLLALPFGLLPLLPAFVVWNVLSAALFAWAAKPYMTRLPLAVAFLTPAGCISLVLGQTGLLIGALWLLAFRHHGWAVGLLSLKPHIGFLSIFTLDRKRFLLATLTVAVVLGLTMLLFPSAVAALPKAIANHFSYLESGRFAIWNFTVVTPRQGYGLAGWAAFAIAAIVMLRRRFDVFTAATATFLIAPYGLHYDLTVACLGMGLAIADEERPWAQAALALGFLTPFIVILGTWFVPPILLAALYAQVTTKRVSSAATGPVSSG